MSSAGLITIPQAATFSSTVAITGAATLSSTGASRGAFSLGGLASTGGDLRFFQDTTEQFRAYMNPADTTFYFRDIANSAYVYTVTAGANPIFNVTKALTVGTTLAVTGAATFSSTVTMGALTATTGAFSGNITVNSTISLGAAGTQSGLAYFLYQTDANSRSWCLRNDQTTSGDFEIQQATTRGGGTYAYALRFDASRNATFSGTLAVTGAATFSSTVTAATVYSTTVGVTNRDLYIDSTGLMGYVSSIRASKTNITPLTDTAWLDALTPVAFNYRKKDEDGAYTDEANTPLEYGLIAEDVEGVNAELVFYDETEDGLALRGVSYNKLMIPLLQRVQALTARVAALEAV